MLNAAGNLVAQAMPMYGVPKLQPDLRLKTDVATTSGRFRNWRQRHWTPQPRLRRKNTVHSKHISAND